MDMREEERIFASLMPESSDAEKKKSFMEQVRETLFEKQTEIQTQIDEESKCTFFAYFSLKVLILDYILF